VTDPEVLAGVGDEYLPLPDFGGTEEPELSEARGRGAVPLPWGLGIWLLAICTAYVSSL